jgi:S-sulfo-L-cysteine synthase (O-acetyl-L-serine-dependent)
VTADEFPTLADVIGNTPVVRLVRLAPANSIVLVKLEGANPAGSVKDRPAFAMVADAEASGRITPGDVLVEATSGNTGIALAAAAAAYGYGMVLVMPENASKERIGLMAAYGARIVLTPKDVGMEGARDEAARIAADEGAIELNQFANPANPAAHYRDTAREIWEQSHHRITHFVSSMGTTGTITGVSHALKELNPNVRIIGVQPAPGESVPGIRAWPKEYLPSIFDPSAVDETREVSAARAVEVTKELARVEGLALGPSSGGAVAIANDIAAENPGAVVVVIAPDRADRYLSTDLFNE